MNARDRSELDAYPVPVDEAGVPALSKVVYRDAWRTAWMIGKRLEVYGPSYDKINDAVAASRYVNERAAS